MKKLRIVLVIIGVLVWVPYMIMKYGMHIGFPVGYILAVHIPCMVTALILRLLEAKKKRGGS